MIQSSNRYSGIFADAVSFFVLVYGDKLVEGRKELLLGQIEDKSCFSVTADLNGSARSATRLVFVYDA